MRALLPVLLLLWSAASRAEPGPAEQIFARLSPAVVQVRVMDQASGDKSGIGSGFQVAADGLVATNFHVVAAVARQPERYRLEYLAADGTPVPLELLDVDVIHDLALLRTERPLAAVVPLARARLARGQRLYSIGNPYDLAMTIIEGTYNGFVDGARYRRILFSASLNPGMSGGPTLNARGEVIGVNVARGGEQLSFLVPVEYLAALIGRAEDAAWRALDLETRIAAALSADQDEYFGALLAAPWQSQRFAGFRVPGRLGGTMKCWGGSSDDEKNRFDHAFQQCSSEDQLYLEEGLETGKLEYTFHAFSSAELNSVQFYGLLAGHYRHGPQWNANAEEHVGNFRCREDFLRGRGIDWRISFCARRYRRFGELFDVSVAMATTELRGRGLVAKLGINGISESRALVFLRRFVEAIEWQP